MLLYENLDSLLGIALTLSTFFVGIFIVVKFIHRKSQPFLLEITNHFLLVCFLLWFALYAITTRLELDAMNAVFDPKDLPGLSVSYGMLAFAFSVLFSLLVLTHRNLFFSFPIVMALGFSDLFGNLRLISGMQLILQNRLAAGGTLSGAERVWFEYYLENPQLLRIATYMAIAFVGFLVFLPSRVRYLKAQFLADSLHRGIPIKMEFFQQRWLRFEVFGKLTFAAAIIYNEVTIGLWRYSREVALAALVPGLGWSPGDVIP